MSGHMDIIVIIIIVIIIVSIIINDGERGHGVP